jgi:hypothetical protein
MHSVDKATKRLSPWQRAASLTMATALP